MTLSAVDNRFGLGRRSYQRHLDIKRTGANPPCLRRLPNGPIYNHGGSVMSPKIALTPMNFSEASGEGPLDIVSNRTKDLQALFS